MSKSLIDEVVQAAPNRRRFLKTIGAATAAVGAMSLAGATPAEAQTPTEVDVLNFALNLEYLESEFHTFAVYGVGIEHFGIGVSGLANSPNPTTGGTTVGGHKVNFWLDLALTRQIATQISADERAHVTLLRSVLGDAAIAKPNINLDALGFGFRDQSEYLKLGRIMEDVGLSAYTGSAHLLTTPLIIQNSARIVGTEGEHVSTIRTQIAQLRVPTSPPLDGADLLPPPSGPQDQYLSVNVQNGLTAVRTPGQVLYLVYGNRSGVSSGGFFPTGVNGAITTSTGPATAANLSTNPPV